MRRHWMATLIAVAGCLNSDAQLSSTIGDTLMDTTAEPPGENCPEGGILLSFGPDENRDGLLEPDEVTQREYICNGYNPGVPLAEQTDEPPGDNCAYGGTRLDIGNDVDQDGVLDPEEISETIYLCDDAPIGGGFKVPQAVAASYERACAIREGGELVCWGDDLEGGGVPAPPGQFISVDPFSEYDTCAVGVDGAVRCWSSRYEWDWAWVVPEGKFTAWDGHCGLREDGTVACLDGAALDGTYASMASSGCHQVVLERYQCDWFACGVRSDGTVRCENVTTGEASALLPSPSGAFTQVSVSMIGAFESAIKTPFACGIRVDGTIDCWGDTTTLAGRIPTGTFQSVSAGFRHACGVRTDGTLACWGGNSPRNPTADISNVPEGRFRTVSAGYYQSCAIRDDGELQCWGWCNGDGICVTPPEVYR
jgi:hypothetical protein